MSEHELWNELGNLYYLSGSFDQAIHAYNKAIQLNTEFGKPYSNLALIYAKQAKYEEAINLYQRSLDLLTEDEEKAITWNRLGNVYRHQKEYQEALSAFQCADDLRPNIAEHHVQSSQMLYVASESESVPADKEQQVYQNHSADYMIDVEPEFDEVLPELVPVDAEVLLDEAAANQSNFKNLGVENIAEPESPPLVEAVEENPTSERTAETLDESKEPLKEEVLIDSDTNSLSDVPQVANDVVVVTDEQASVSPDAEHQADEEEMEANATHPVPNAHAEKDTETLSAEEVDSEWKQLDPENEAPETELEPAAQIEDASDKTEGRAPDPIDSTHPVDTTIEAVLDEDAQKANREIGTEEEDLTKQIEINPRNATTWEALGTLYKTAGRYEEAIQAFKQAIEIAPDTVSYYHNLGLVYSAQGNNENAIATFQKVLELDPNHGLAHASLGGYYKKTGLEELAQKHIGIAMKYIYESENEYNRACLDAICGNNDQAIKLLRTALENKQTYVDWVLHDPDLDSLREDNRFKRLIAEFSK